MIDEAEDSPTLPIMRRRVDGVLPKYRNSFMQDPVRVWAAKMIALEGKTSRQVAELVGRKLSTVVDWRKHPEFQGLVKEFQESAMKNLLEDSVGNRFHRISRLDSRFRQVGNQIDKMVDEVGVFPVKLSQEEREIAKQAAIETGQWSEKQELSVIPKQYVGFDPDDV